VLSLSPAKALSCYDGDTCRLEREILPGRDRVRLANADTPEIEGQCQEEIDRAMMARDYTRALVVGEVVTLSAIEPDKYRKRIDAYVSIDGRDLGDALIAAGLARPYTGGQRAGGATRGKQACRMTSIPSHIITPADLAAGS
jgi:endonuclease YncB( thermonuclease family)